MKTTHLVWLVPLAAAAGYFASAKQRELIVQSPAGENSESEQTRPEPVPDRAEDAATLTRLADEREALEEEIAALVAQLPVKPSAAERLEFAEMFLDAVRRNEKGDDAAWDFIRDALLKLDADIAHVFFKELANPDPRSDPTTLILYGLACGGPDAEAWMTETLAHGEQQFRDIVLQICVGGTGEEQRVLEVDIDRMAIGPRLLEQAHALVLSGRPLERAAGLRLLGHEPGPGNLPLLRTKASGELDTEMIVRLSAIHALGFAGDAESLRWLEGDLLRQLEGQLKPDAELIGTVRRSVARLRKRGVR